MCTSNYTFSSKITTQNNIQMVRHDTIKFKWMTSSIRKINSYLINTVTNDTQNWGGTITTKCINISIKQIIKILNSKNQLVILNCLYEFLKKFFLSRLIYLRSMLLFIKQKFLPFTRQIVSSSKKRTIIIDELVVTRLIRVRISQLCQAMSRPLFNSKKYVLRFWESI